MRWLLLASLTLLAVLAAVAAAQRTRPSGRAELALTSCMLWQAMVGVPIYLLGFTNHLTATALAITSALFSLAVLGATSWRGSVARSALGVVEGVVELVALPFDGLARAKKQRSLVLLPLLLAAVLIVWTAFCSYFTPSWRQWDSLWYHETIVGYTIQNHGFAVVDLTGDTQKVNGYPRFCEMMQLWFVIFTDRRLIELPNSLMAPGFMFATYLLARRYTRDVVACMGWAAVVLVIPSPYLLQLTYIDLHVALLTLAATYYATRPTFRLVDAWLAALSITLCIGAKYLALPPAGIALIIAIVRLLRHHGLLRLRSVATFLGGGALVFAMSASIFWRNWRVFKNPLWPDLAYDNPARGIHFPSVSYGENPFDMNMKLSELIPTLLSVPYSLTNLGRKGDVYHYGIAMTWVVLPLGALAVAVVVLRFARDLLARIVRVRAWRSPDAYNPLLVTLPLAAQIWLSPELWQSRYHLANLAALAALIAYLGGRPRWQAFGEGAAAAAAVASIIAFTWMKPRWYWFPSELVKLAAIPYPEREVTPAADVSKDIDVHSGSSITKVAGMERERMKPGEIFAWDYTQFPALLWKNDFTNKVVYVPNGPGYYDRVMKVGARLALCQNGVAHCAEFVAASTGKNPTWEDVGAYNVENWSRVYKRLTP